MKQLIIAIDENTDFEALPEELQKAINKLKIAWPQAKMIGTHAVDGKQLVLIMAGVDGETLTEFMNGDYISGTDTNGDPIITNFNLGWQVMAEEGLAIDQSQLLPYIDEVAEYDEDGELIDFSPVTDITGKLQTYSGHKWTY